MSLTTARLTIGLSPDAAPQHDESTGEFDPVAACGEKPAPPTERAGAGPDTDEQGDRPSTPAPPAGGADFGEDTAGSATEDGQGFGEDTSGEAESDGAGFGEGVAEDARPEGAGRH